MIIKFGINVKKFLADDGYDSNATRLMMVKKLESVSFILLNASNCKGKNEEEVKEEDVMLEVLYNEVHQQVLDRPRL